MWIKLLTNKWTYIIAAFTILLIICGLQYLRIGDLKNDIKALNLVIVSKDNIIANKEQEIKQCDTMVTNQKLLQSSMQSLASNTAGLRNEIFNMKWDQSANIQGGDKDGKEPAEIVNNISRLYLASRMRK